MTDRLTIRLIVISAGLLGALSIAAIALLAVQEKPIPDVLGIVAGGSLTGLLGLLAKTDSAPEAGELVPMSVAQTFMPAAESFTPLFAEPDASVRGFAAATPADVEVELLPGEAEADGDLDWKP